jgi:hypothetical protein
MYPSKHTHHGSPCSLLMIANVICSQLESLKLQRPPAVTRIHTVMSVDWFNLNGTRTHSPVLLSAPCWLNLTSTLDHASRLSRSFQTTEPSAEGGTFRSRPMFNILAPRHMRYTIQHLYLSILRPLSAILSAFLIALSFLQIRERVSSFEGQKFGLL